MAALLITPILLFVCFRQVTFMESATIALYTLSAVALSRVGFMLCVQTCPIATFLPSRTTSRTVYRRVPCVRLYCEYFKHACASISPSRVNKSKRTA